MAGIQFTAGEHEFQLFHQQRKGLVRMVCIRVAEPASDTGTNVTACLPGAKTGRHGAGQPPPGGRDCRREVLSRGVCLTR